MEKRKIIKDWMKKAVISIRQNTTVKEAAGLMLENRIGTLPVVDEDGILVGVTTIQDIVQIIIPDFVDLLTDIDFVKDFGAKNTPSMESLAKANELTVVDIMEEPVAVKTTSDLMRAISMITKYNLMDLPVTEDDVLVGIASRVDICRGLLHEWQDEKI